MEHAMIIVALFYIYYHIGGLATTNILRLTKGNSMAINASKCACDSCGAKIPPLLQLPIISFIICGGKCRNCKTSIPLYPLFLEITIMLGMFTLTAAFRFSVWGVAASYLFYEIVRIVVILIKRRRQNDFAKQYLVAVASMLPFFALTELVALIYSAL